MNNQPQPPKLLLRFFRWFCHPDYVEDIEGDLNERFLQSVLAKGNTAARCIYAIEILRLFRPSLMRKFGGSVHLNLLGMFKIFMISGWRNLLKHKGYTAVNVLGLSFGIGAVALLSLIIHQESTYDRFHKNCQSIFRLGNTHEDGSMTDLIVTPETPRMKKEFQEVELATRCYDHYGLFQSGNHVIQGGFYLVDQDFADMFDFEVIEGTLNEGLKPQNMAITESFAKKMFPDQDPMGKSIKMMETNKLLTVACVMRDPPKNSTLQFEGLIVWDNVPEWLHEDQSGNWYNTFNIGYIKLRDGANPELLKGKFHEFTKKYFLPDREKWGLALFPLSNEYFRTKADGQLIQILTIIAVLILLLSVFNFVNLSVSQSLSRVKEIGVRKVLGSARSMMFLQFLTESVLVSALAMVLGLVLVVLAIPYVNEYFDYGLEASLMALPQVIAGLLLLCIFIAFTASFFPAFIFSKIQMAKSLKGNIAAGVSGNWLRKPLLVLQFGCSFLLILGAVVIWSQVHYMKTKNLHFNGHNVVAVTMWNEMFKNPEESYKKLKLLRDELETRSYIKAVTSSQNVPGRYYANYNLFGDKGGKEVSLRQTVIDQKYFETMGMDLAMGQGFSGNETDAKNIIINEAAMSAYGWDNVDDKYLTPRQGDKSFKVIGVVKDFNYQSLKSEIEPMIFFYSPFGYTLAVKVADGHEMDGLQALEQLWSELDAYTNLEYFFVDQEFDKLYAEQERVGMSVTFFSGVGILIALLGLLAAVTQSIQVRKKEIGIRKVMGASLSNLIRILSMNFIYLILFGILAGSVLGYHLCSQFLNDFAYRIALSPLIFLGASGAVLMCAAVLIAYQAMRVARANPSGTLRDE